MKRISVNCYLLKINVCILIFLQINFGKMNSDRCLKVKIKYFCIIFQPFHAVDLEQAVEIFANAKMK